MRILLYVAGSVFAVLGLIGAMRSFYMGVYEWGFFGLLSSLMAALIFFALGHILKRLDDLNAKVSPSYWGRNGSSSE